MYCIQDDISEIENFKKRYTNLGIILAFFEYSYFEIMNLFNCLFIEMPEFVSLIHTLRKWKMTFYIILPLGLLLMIFLPYLEI